jgi:hypothetical protein
MAVLLMLAGMSCAAAAPRISGGDLPGRERDRFVDPPVARALQQRVPDEVLRRDERPAYRTCPRPTRHGRIRIVRC